MARTPKDVTDAELRVLQALWDLGPSTIRQLTDRLCRIFDVVLMDSPPVALASPTETLASFADGVIMVVKADGIDAQIAQQAKAQLEKAQVKILGVVLNQVDMRHADPLLYYYGAYRP